MRVSDNGCGILKEDIRPAFIRHATSKVKVEGDLDAIATLGFRGEALASVSSVSHLELLTKAREEETGTRYLIEGGEEVLFDDAGCPDGTTFIIRDLFYNVPARMKFLKTDMERHRQYRAFSPRDRDHLYQGSEDRPAYLGRLKAVVGDLRGIRS